MILRRARRLSSEFTTYHGAKVPYKKAPREKVKLPKRQKPHGYRDPGYAYKFVPEKF